MLSNLVNTQGSTQGGATQYSGAVADIAGQQYYAGQGLGNTMGTLNGLVNTTGNSALQQQTLENTPGYQFALTQGSQALARSGAAQGMNGSGNLAAGLTQYGQGLASQTYQQDVTNLSNLATQQSGMLQSSAGLYNTLDVNAANNYSNQFQQLAQLSGMNIGNPGVAGQLQQQNNIAQSAAFQQLANAGGSAASNLWNQSQQNSNYDTGISSSDTFSNQPGSSSQNIDSQIDSWLNAE
jgi:hypothetical protein